MNRPLLIIMFIVLIGSSKNQDVTLIAHRGASDEVPEHTIRAYEKAVKDGADFIEIDLLLTKDGELIAFHDRTVDRTTGGTGEVIDFTVDELKELDAGSWFSSEFKGEKIVTLEEVFKRFGKDIHYYIETRTYEQPLEMEKQLLGLINKYNLESNVIIQSFSERSLLKVKNLNNNITVSKLIKEDLSSTNFTDVSKYADYVAIESRLVDEKLITVAKDNDLKVHVFFEADPYQEELKRVIHLGADGVIADNVLEAKQ